uniref:Zinc finger protein RFP n=1 Tax=Chrysemys picta bellii TaxID=8478 RepID=A0A8C3FQ25_CHRPI
MAHHEAVRRVEGAGARLLGEAQPSLPVPLYRGESVCDEHQEPLKLFCEEDQTPICVVCDRSRTHRAHTVVPIEEAAQEYKTQNKRQKVVSEFQQLRQFLEEEERLLLAQLEKLEKEIVKIQNDNVTKMSEEISRLSDLISELEEKCQKPASEFLQKGKFLQPVEISPELEKRLRLSSAPNALTLFPVNVTLDPDTAHPRLILSEDRKSVRWGDTCQLLTTNPERFDSWACVLGSEGFISGRHCWKVEVGDRGFWAVGVARESVRREGEVSFNPEVGIWAVQWLGLFQALTSPATALPFSQVPRRIQICLDCEWGQVTFFDADNKVPIFTFPPASVPGERIYPWLWVGAGSQLRLCP